MQGVLEHLGAAGKNGDNSKDAASQKEATEATATNTATFPFSPSSDDRKGSQKQSTGKATNTATFPFSPSSDERKSSQQRSTENAAKNTDSSSQASPNQSSTATFPF